MKNIACILFLMVSIISCAPNIHSPQYTSPTGGGYNQQVIGALCSHCGRQMNISWHQYNDRESISCPYCGQQSNTKEAAARWVPVMNARNQQANQAAVNTLIGGTTQVLDARNQQLQKTNEEWAEKRRIEDAVENALRNDRLLHP